MNHEDLKDKLRRSYFELQKEKLANDTFCIALQEQIKHMMAYSAGPIVTVTNGKIDYEIPESIKIIQMQMEDYIKSNYPVLYQYKNQTPTRPPIYEYSFVKTPEKLTLDKIDARLTLFATYLKYRLNCLFGSHGWVNELPLEYDEWLFMEGYEGLIEVTWN